MPESLALSVYACMICARVRDAGDAGAQGDVGVVGVVGDVGVRALFYFGLNRILG